jgi:transglutaminase-like putative cysteine protease
MKKIYGLLLVNTIALPGFSQVNVLDASTISKSLKENAHSVKREEKINFEVYDIDAAKLTVHEVYTVLDAEGEDVLHFFEYSTAFRKLEDAEIKVYDAQGKFINKYKLKEMRAESMGEGLVEDGKVYYFRVAAPAYPVTVQYDYEVKYKGTLNYPAYNIEAMEQSVESSVYTASVPPTLDLRFKAQNTNITPSINAVGKSKFYRWEAKNLAAIADEEGTAADYSLYPQIWLAPNKFSMDGNDGDLTSWKSFGNWYYNLCKGVVNLSDDTKNSLREMVKNAANDRDKMKIIYKYLQANFRYVSIQLGIGGYKPFDAAFVNQKKYGDCKALSNYMKACLDAIGINSYYAIINCEYNSPPVDPSFPQNQFNHVILCVPSQKDTTWLECTSKTTDFGSLGSFTENRNALLVTPEGGVLVATPRSKAGENTFSSLTTVKLNEDASGESESDIKTSGEFKQELIGYLVNEKKDDQKKYLVNDLGFIQPDDFEFTRDAKIDSSETAFKLLLDKVPEFTAGSKMFLNPRIYKIWDMKLPPDEKRTHDFYFEFPFLKTDTTVYQLPENYTVENLPKARDNKFEYGFFKTNYTYDETANTVTSVAVLSLSQNVIPADKYVLTHKFFSNVTEEYTEKIVIKRK